VTTLRASTEKKVGPRWLSWQLFFTNYLTVDTIQSIIGNLLNLDDWVESKATVVAFRITIPFEEEIELLDGCGSLVTLAVVVPEVEKAKQRVLR
jgi:hypothetical protein